MPEARANRIIDVHHHFTTPSTLAEVEARGPDTPRRGWSLERSLEMMDEGRVQKAMVSIPNIWLGDREAVKHAARDSNEFVARIVSDHPSRFGLFACLPLPQVEASLREIEHAFDVLGADGVILMTSFENKWLGDTSFDPVLDELNRRKAVVFVHPTAPDCCRGLLPGINDAAIEFGTDTTRALVNLVFGGTVLRCPDINFIFCHCGGTVPSLVARFNHLPRMNPAKAAFVPNGFEAELKKFWYDIAQTAHPVPLASIIKLVTVSRVVFGTDFPYRNAVEHTRGLEAFGLSDAEIRAIEWDNAARLLGMA